MENLTHTLTGLMLSRAGFNRWCHRATPLLLLAANIPDIDIVTRFGGSLTYLDQHRGITHALAAVPLMAAIPVLAVRAFGSIPLLRAWVTAMAGVLSHLLFDWTNTYGIRLLMPFSSDWLRLDITNVIDLWIWAALLLAVAGPLLSRLVSSEIGAKPGTGRGAAIAALCFLVLYNAGRVALHERALNTVTSHLYEGAPPQRAAVFPHFANPFAWVAVVEGRNFAVVQKINLILPYDPVGGTKYYAPEPSGALAAARGTDVFRRYLNFAQLPFWRVTPADQPEGGVQVEVMDLRFGDPDAPRFVATAVVDAAQRVVSAEYSFGPLRPR